MDKPIASIRQQRGHDHICHATATVLGDPRRDLLIEVRFAGREELQWLIDLLTQLRDRPETLDDHVELQDWHLCSHTRRKARPEDVEIVFHAPGAKQDWAGRQLLKQGRQAMRELRGEQRATAPRRG